MILSISFSQIKYVIALEKTGSFSEAANLCFVTQSTLSTMIKKLENQLSIKLFDRQHKPVILTPEGQKLMSQFKVIKNEYENLFELCKQTKEKFHGTLKIGIIPTLAPFLLPLFLDTFSTKYPNLTLEINEITTDTIIRKLKLRAIDIGLLSIPLNEPSLDQKSLFKEEFQVYDMREQTRKSKLYRIEDIDLSNLWLLEESHCLTNQIGRICQLKNDWAKDGNIKLMSGSLLSLLELVKLKKGITLLPKLATLNNNIVEQKYVYNLDEPVPVRDIGIVAQTSFLKRELYAILVKEISSAVHPLLGNISNTVDVKPF